MPTNVSDRIRPINKLISLREDTTIASIILYTNTARPEYKEQINDPEENVNDGNAITGSSAGLKEEEIDRIAKKVVLPKGGASVMDKKGLIATLDMTKDGNNTSKRGGYYGIFNNFMLTSVSESRKTINKVHMNFADSWNVFFFGNSPVMLSMSGGFIDTEEFPYYQEFMVAYEKYISGERLVENNLNMLISYDGKIIEGYILNINTSTSVTTESYKQFSMVILVKDIYWVRFNEDETGDPKPNYMFNKNRLTETYGDRATGQFDENEERIAAAANENATTSA